MESQDVEAYELVITGEHGDSVEYHIYGRNKRWLAEAFVTLQGADCFGEINWMIEPTPEQIEAGVELSCRISMMIMVDSFQLEVKHNGELLEVYRTRSSRSRGHTKMGHRCSEVADEPVFRSSRPG